jgi:hypothetical protein
MNIIDWRSGQSTYENLFVIASWSPDQGGNLRITPTNDILYAMLQWCELIATPIMRLLRASQ